jgi:hypothetical protein
MFDVERIMLDLHFTVLTRDSRETVFGFIADLAHYDRRLPGFNWLEYVSKTR